MSPRLSIVCLLSALAGISALAGCARENAGNDQGKAGVGASNSSAELAAAGPVTGVLDRSHAGTQAPTFSFEDPDGRPTSMAAFRGRPTLVNLWATWCAPCVVEMPSLDALARREGDALNVVALSQDLNGRALVSRFFADRRLTALDAYLDPQMQFMMGQGLSTLPTTILYDAQGREVWRMVGRADWESDRVARLLDEASGG